MALTRAGATVLRYAKEFWWLLRDAALGWSKHQASRTGAALAFYTVFSLAPVLLLAIAIAGAFFGKQAARGEIFQQVSELIGSSAASTVQTLVTRAGEVGAGTMTTVISVLTVVIGANTALVELKYGLDQTWEVPAHEQQGFWYFIRTRLLALAIVLSLGGLLLASLVISAALGALERLSHGEYLVNVALDWLNTGVSFALVAVLFATLYRVLPSVRIPWRDVLVGAIFTSVLIAVGRFAIGVYLSRSPLASTYGAAGSVIVMLVWVYYSAQIFLYGAEFTRCYALRFGSMRPPASQAAQPLSTA